MQKFTSIKPIYQILLIVAFNLCFFAMAAWLLPIRFETSDDITFANFVNGNFFGEPDFHWGFLSCYYGMFLCLLYNLFHGIEWYTIFHCLAQIVAMTIITIYYIKHINNQWLKVTFILFFYLIWLYLIARLQFTSTTAMLSFAACLLLLERKFVFGGLVLLWASLLRFEAAGMIGLFMSPIFIYSYRFDWRKAYLPLLVILLVIGSVHISDSLFYQSEYRTEQREHNIARSHIQDNPSAWRAMSDLPRGISVSDYKLFLSFFYDSSIFNTTVLKEIGDTIDAIPIKYKIKDNFYAFILPNKISLVLIILLSAIVLLILKDTRSRLFYLFSFLLWFVVLNYIGLSTYIKPYVYFSSLLVIFFSAVYYINQQMTKYDCLVIICFIFYGVYIGFQLNETLKMHDKELFSEQQYLLSNVNGGVLALGYDECVLSPFKIQNGFPCKLEAYAFLTTTTTTTNTFLHIVQNHIKMMVDKKSTIPETMQTSLRIHDNMNYQIRILKETEHYQLIDFVENETN